MLQNIIMVGLGGSLGAISRYLVSTGIHHYFGKGFPLGTLTANTLGCFAIGLLAALADEKLLLSQSARLLLMVGFLGAFTTFSTFSLETWQLWQDGQPMKAGLNVIGSLLTCFTGLALGLFLARYISHVSHQ
jgi:fluoride exporter